MSILSPLPAASMVTRPFADYLNVSVPSEVESQLRDHVTPLFDSLGNCSEVAPGLFQFYEIGVKGGEIKPLPRGAVKLGRRGKVATLSTSGQVLRMMRDKGVFSEYLAAIGALPHRVTMLHATADYMAASVPAVVKSVKDAAYAGEISLTRKRVLPSQCQHVFSVDVDGQETGTIYLGQRANADVWAKVYDKRHERLSRGFPDPGSLCRVEVACMSAVGATLRDVADPFDIFFYYAGRSLVMVPPEYSGWSPHGEGYVLGERRERSLFERFDALISSSLDIRRLAGMAVDLYGPDIAPQVIGRRVLAAYSQ